MAFFMLALYHARVFTAGIFILFPPIRKSQVPIYPCRESIEIRFDYGAEIRSHIENKSFGNPYGIPSPFRGADCAIAGSPMLALHLPATSAESPTPRGNFADLHNQSLRTI